MTHFADWPEKFGDGLNPLSFDAPHLDIKTCCWDSTKQAKRLHLQIKMNGCAEYVELNRSFRDRG